jgi:hypothetical protein
VKPLDPIADPRAVRERLGMYQGEFWARVGVTQSGGSRYECHLREMPRPVRELLRLVYVEKLDLTQVKRIDFEITLYLKTERPRLYQTLQRVVKGYRRGLGGSGDSD